MLSPQPAPHSSLHPDHNTLDLFYQKIQKKTLLKHFNHEVITKEKGSLVQKSPVSNQVTKANFAFTTNVTDANTDVDLKNINDWNKNKNNSG